MSLTGPNKISARSDIALKDLRGASWGHLSQNIRHT